MNIMLNFVRPISWLLLLLLIQVLSVEAKDASEFAEPQGRICTLRLESKYTRITYDIKVNTNVEKISIDEHIKRLKRKEILKNEDHSWYNYGSLISEPGAAQCNISGRTMVDDSFVDRYLARFSKSEDKDSYLSFHYIHRSPNLIVFAK